MESGSAIGALAALAQETRLSVFKLLVLHEPHGMAAGEIALETGTRANTLSTHLSLLSASGLVGAERHGRSIVYRANLDRLRSLVLYLVQDCCAGSTELCAPLLAELTPCC